MTNKFIKPVLLTLCFMAGLFSSAQTGIAFMQFIHNCADPTVDTVDVYINQQYFDSNVVYRSVIGFVTEPSDTAITFEILKKHTYGIYNAGDVIGTFPFDSLPNNQLSVLLLSGIDSTGFAPNPNGLDTAFNLYVATKDSSSQGNDTATVALKFFNGVTDLPKVNIVDLFSGTTVATGLQYGDTSSLATFPHYGVFDFQLINPSSGQNYGTFYADLSSQPTFGGQSLFIFASGFSNIAANDSGPSISLTGVLNNGTIIPFPVDTANFQLLHNCADTSADSLNIFINGQLVFRKLAFRNATREFSVNAYTTYDIAIAPKDSTSVNGAFWHYVYQFGPDEFHIATISGLKNPTGYALNPDGISTAFNVIEKAPAELTGSSFGNFDFFFLNGATDAPALNVIPVIGGPAIFTNYVAYSGESDYYSSPLNNYTLQVADTLGNVVGNYFANFPAFPAQSGVLLTSGFLNPANNNNGPDIGLYMVPIAGGPFIPLFSTTGIHPVSNPFSTNIFPNPANSSLFIRFDLPKSGNTLVEIADLSGRALKQIFNGNAENNRMDVHADISDLNEGIYLVRIITNEGTANSRFVIAR